MSLMFRVIILSKYPSYWHIRVGIRHHCIAQDSYILSILYIVPTPHIAPQSTKEPPLCCRCILDQIFLILTSEHIFFHRERLLIFVSSDNKTLFHYKAEHWRYFFVNSNRFLILHIRQQWFLSRNSSKEPSFSQSTFYCDYKWFCPIFTKECYSNIIC